VKSSALGINWELYLKRKKGHRMKRIAVCVMLATMSVAWPVRAKAQGPGVDDYERQSREAYKKQLKASKKAMKKQLKLARKTAKKQRKAMKKYEKEQQRQARG
jgi:peptide subunit release factor RF-3